MANKLGDNQVVAGAMKGPSIPITSDGNQVSPGAPSGQPPAPGNPIQPAEQGKEVVRQSGMVAKKDFEIHQNDNHFVIKAGDDLSSIPVEYHENLKTEGVID